MKHAVIIKHPFRDNDFRVDIIDIPEDIDFEIVKRALYFEMLGPFEVVAITSRLNMDRDISKVLSRFCEDGENHQLKEKTECISQSLP